MLTLAAGVVLSIALAGDVAFADGQPGSREWRPIRSAVTWFASHPQPVATFIWSQSYADVLFARDPMENQLRFGDRAGALSVFASARPGTLVQWDDRVGPTSYGLSGRDIEGHGICHALPYAECAAGLATARFGITRNGWGALIAANCSGSAASDRNVATLSAVDRERTAG